MNISAEYKIASSRLSDPSKRCSCESPTLLQEVKSGRASRNLTSSGTSTSSFF